MNYGSSEKAPKLNIPRIEIRRSSTMQFPVSATAIDETKLADYSNVVTASNSSYSLNYSDKTVSSLRARMERYRCCCGRLRLRLAASLVAGICLIISIFSVCGLLTLSSSFSKDHQLYIVMPMIGAVIFQIVASLTMLVAIIIHSQHLLVPFIVNCSIHLCACIFGTVTLIVTKEEIRRHSPIAVICACVVLLLYLWFLSITCMTYMLLKTNNRYGDMRDLENRSYEVGSSSFI